MLISIKKEQGKWQNGKDFDMQICLQASLQAAVLLVTASQPARLAVYNFTGAEMRAADW